jgi:hypothetical protein
MGSRAHAEVSSVGLKIATKINVSDAQAEMIVKAAGEGLTSTLDLKVVSGPAAEAKLPAAAKSDECLGSTECLVSVGEKLGVERVLMLVVVGLGDQVKIEATWVNVKEKKTALRPAIDADLQADAIRTAFSKEASGLLPDASPVEVPNEAVDGPSDTGQGSSAEGTDNQEDAAISAPEPRQPRGRHFDGASTALLIGGGALIGAGTAGYFIIKERYCDGGTTDCKSGVKTASWIADGATYLGIGLVGVAVYRYLTSAEEPEQPPIAIQAGPDQVGIAFGGRF